MSGQSFSFFADHSRRFSLAFSARVINVHEEMAEVRPLTESDLSGAQRIVRRAFGTFLGAPDLDNFWTDFDYVYGRHGAEHTASFAADHGATSRE